MEFLHGLLGVLASLVLGGVSYFLWAKEKAKPAFLMMVGFGLSFVGWFFLWVLKATADPRLWMWLFVGGLCVAAFGFFLTFRKDIQAQLDALKAKAKDKVSGGGEEESGESEE